MTHIHQYHYKFFNIILKILKTETIILSNKLNHKNHETQYIKFYI